MGTTWEDVFKHVYKFETVGDNILRVFENGSLSPSYHNNLKSIILSKL